MTNHLDAGFDSLRTWYYSEIRSLADDAIEAIVGCVVGLNSRSPRTLGYVVGIEIEPGQDRREFLQEWVEQALDGHSVLIYTRETKAALLASDNEDAYADETGEESADETVRCYYAMRADVWEHLEARSEEWVVQSDDTVG